MKQGEIIKKLRIERGMSQKMLVKDISTRSTLSSFECRQTELSSSTLLKYLEKLNVKFDEFQFLVHDNHFSDKEMTTNKFISSLERYTNKQEVFLFLNELNEKYASTNDNFYLMISAQLQILKADTLEFDVTNVEIEMKKVKEYLFQVENWCHFELTIFSNLLFIFGSEEIIIQFENVISKMWMLQDTIHYNSLISTFLINGCFLGFEREEEDLAILFIKHLELISSNSRFVEAKIYTLIFKGLFPVLRGESCDYVSIKKGLQILDILNIEKSNKLRDFIFKCLEHRGYEVNLKIYDEK